MGRTDTMYPLLTKPQDSNACLRELIHTHQHRMIYEKAEMMLQIFGDWLRA